MTEAPMATGDTQLVIVDDENALARAAAERLTAALAGAIAARGTGHLVLTGGSSAVNLYRELAGPAWPDALDWTRVNLWWGDERFVPVDHADSNIGLAYNTLLASLPIRAENVHPYQVDETLSESDPADLVAERYVDAIEELVPRVRGLPAFDVILLGVGGDGHILSVFPASRALAEDAPLVLAVPAPQHIGPHHPRITLNPRLLPAARQVIVMVSGDAKADIVARVLAGEHDPQRLPAQLAVLPNAVWLLDRAAAAQLDQR